MTLKNNILRSLRIACLSFIIPLSASAENVGIFFNPKTAQASFAANEVKAALAKMGVETEMLDLVGQALEERVAEGMASESMNAQAGAIVRLFNGQTMVRRNTIGFELAGAGGAAWADEDGELARRGEDFLMRQVSCIGGGTTEIAANVIAERVLGMPREPAKDRDVAFRDVPRSGG